MIRALGLASLLLAPGALSRLTAATINATTGNLADVQAAVNSSVTGDTVHIPAGKYYWTSYLACSGKGITLEGTGMGSDPAVDTIIVDENPVRAGPSVMRISWSDTSADTQFTLQYLAVEGGVTNSAVDFDGAIEIRASNLLTGNSRWRFHHLRTKNVHARAFYIRAWSGLVDHCDQTFNAQTGNVVDGHINSTEWGDRGWANPVAFGTVDEAVVFEDCVAVYSGTSLMASFADAFGGAKKLARFCTFTNCFWGGHGTESTQRSRGMRWSSAHNSRFVLTISPSESAAAWRSGSGIFASNVLVGSWPSMARAWNGREVSPYPPWNGADGNNVWDKNFTNIYETGTISLGSTNTGVITDSSKTWSSGQWVGYHIRDLNRSSFGMVRTTSADAVTLYPRLEGGYPNFATGDAYEIRKIDRALDQPGVGQGDLISGGSNAIAPTPTTWPNQIDEPIYFWANTGSKTNFSNSGYYNIIAGTHYKMEERPGYVFLSYPHPYITGAPPPPTPPAAPSNLQATVFSSSEIDLTWTDNSSDELGFSVERSLTGGGAGFSQIANLGPNISAYADQNLSASTTYYYRVRAFNLGGQSAYTAESGATTATTQPPVIIGPRGRRLGLLPRP